MINTIMEDNTQAPARKHPTLGQLAKTPQHGEHNAYAKFLATLSPEEYEEHCRQKTMKMNTTIAMRKTVQELWHSAITDNSGTWNSMLQSAAMSVLQRAIERGDPVAFNSISDRILGKVATTMTVNVKEADTEQDILKQIQSMALDKMERQLEQDAKHVETHALHYVDNHTDAYTATHTNTNTESNNDAKTQEK